MPCECYATAAGAERAAMWKRIRPPDGHIPIQGPMAYSAILPHGRSPVYMVDMARLTPAEFERLVQEVAACFNSAAAEVRQQCRQAGMPMPAQEVLVTVCPMHRGLAG